MMRRRLKIPAPQHPIISGRGPHWINYMRNRIFAIPILAPFRYIAVHVIETPGIFLLESNRMGLIIGIGTIPPHGVKIRV
jgi:hypothetical protein